MSVRFSDNVIRSGYHALHWQRSACS